MPRRREQHARPSPPSPQRALAHVHTVFSNGDIVHLFKECFTPCNFAVNRAFMHFAQRQQIDFRALTIRPDVNLLAYENALLFKQTLNAKLRVSDIDWPPHIDPTAEPSEVFNFTGSSPDPHQVVERVLENIRDRNIMINILLANAPHVRRLKVRMSLAVKPSENIADQDLFLHIHRFLDALAQCTAMETLIIEQVDHVPEDGTLNTVQGKLFGIIKTMHNLKFLDFAGNMTIEAFGVQLGDVQYQLTIIDHLPRSLTQLILRDGPAPSMYKWIDFYGLSAGLNLLVSNYSDNFPLLTNISLPSSILSISNFRFHRLTTHMNAGHITRIAFSDPFKINKHQLEPGGGGAIRLREPYRMLSELIKSIHTNIVVDLTGADDAERDERIKWAIDPSLTFSCLGRTPQISDGSEYTTVTMHRRTYCNTIRVLI